MKMIKNGCLIWGILCAPLGLLAQGCSDAGVCSMGNALDTTGQYSNSIELSYGYAIGLEDVAYHNATLSYAYRWNSTWSASALLSYNQASGNFGTLGNLGDVVLMGRHMRPTTNGGTWVLSIGAKVPLSTGNMKINAIPLPMEYQPSLGTVDGLFSVQYDWTHWYLEAAYQLPLVQSNRNSYFDEYSISNIFPTTNLFQRKSDVLGRVGYRFQTRNKKWSFKPNMMGIQHTANDTYEDVFGIRQEIEKSKGLTINAQLFGSYTIQAKSSIQWSLASPLKVRTIRPDGLTRALVASITYQLKF